MEYLRTSDLAKAVGVHSNTVRRYVERGWLPPVDRSLSGYRRFTQHHLECLRLAPLIFFSQFPGKVIRQSSVHILLTTVSGDLRSALELAHGHLELVRAERVQAEAAVHLLECWAQGAPADASSQPLLIGQAAQLLGVSIDMLRNWDRSNLIQVPRDPTNQYRRYGTPEISRLRVIRMLSRAGYSLSAILRMLIHLDQGEKADLRWALDTPRSDEDVYLASDRWLTTLANQEQDAHTIIAHLERLIPLQALG